MKEKNTLLKKYPELILEWNFEKNSGTSPDSVFCGSHKKFWWTCLKDNSHIWEASVSHRTYTKTGCPFCSGKKINKSNCLTTTHPNLATEWHQTKNGKLTPDNITYGNNKKVWWQCLNNKEHEWKISPNSRTNTNSGCPYCSGNKVHLTNSLFSLFPKIATEWHPTKNGKLTPKKITFGSGLKVWWICPKNKNHEYETTVTNRTLHKSGCPYCLYKTEDIIRRYFELLLNKKFIKTKPDWLINPKTNKRLELDGYCEELNLAFEYNGRQHYEAVEYWHRNQNLTDTQQHDKIKIEECKKRNINLIIISYDEINYKTNNATIEKIIMEKLNWEK